MLAAVALACVVAVPGLGLDGLAVRSTGAVGLVVPDAGPTTSEARARAALATGQVVNSLRGDLPSGPQRVRLDCRGGVSVGVPRGGEQPNDRRYGIWLPGPRTLVVSDSTRIPGLASIADVARGRLRTDVSEDDPLAYLRDLDRRIDANSRWRKPALLAFLGAVVAAALVAPGAAVAAFPVALLGNLALGVLGLSGAWAFALAASPLARGRLALLSVGTIALYAAALAADATWVALSPLGPSQNSRFYGLSNVLATLLLPTALIAAALALRVGRSAFAAVAGLAVITVAAGALGADAGGAVVLLVALAAFVLGVTRRVGAAVAVVAAVAAVAVLATLLGPETHVTEAFSDPVSALVERVELSWLRATADAPTALAVVAATAWLALLVVRGPRGPLSLALAAGIATSLLVNDSPLEVSLAGLVAYLALARWEQAQLERRPSVRLRRGRRDVVSRVF